jgi:isochorismate synthase
MWAGVTPEVLVESSSLGFRTMSLAGTRRATQNKEWNEKEYAEQAYVTDYIKDCLKGIVSSLEFEGPYNQKAGELIHLRTDIRGKLSSPGEIRTVLDRLHPTPAVCGTPLKQSQEFICHQETYKRRYYTGYLGVINYDTNSASLFVNLRCMSISEGVAYLYTGGGITAYSNPEEEWLETCHKQHTMLKVLAPFL